MKKFFKILMWIVVALIFLATFIYLFNNSKPKKTEYQIIEPTCDATISRTTLLTGAIEPRDEIEIKPQISGIISEILVEAGEHVNSGDIIAKIKVIPEQSQLSSAENRVKVAATALELQKSKSARTAELYEKKFVSREEYEESQSALRSAEIELASAEDALMIVREGVSATNAQSSNTLVRSTITGLVLDVPVKVGTSVIQSNTFNDGTTIAKVADMTDLIFKGKVDETEVGLLYTGQPMVITIGALQDVSCPASIEYISPKATNENGTNTFEIKAAVNMPDTKNIRAGYSANAAVTLKEVNGIMTIPEAIVEFVGENAFVNVLTDPENMKFERRAIKTGLSDGINIEVTEGINPNDKLKGAAL